MSKKMIFREDAIEIFKLRGEGVSYAELGKKYNVTGSTIGTHLQNFEISLAVESEKTSVHEVAEKYGLDESRVGLAHAFHKFKKHL